MLAVLLASPASAGGTERVSVDSAGMEGNGASSGASISASGRYVAFQSLASNLVASDGNGAQDVFAHDRKTSATERISVDSAGSEGNGASSLPSLSSGARYVAFHSDASNLVASDGNGARDVLVHDRK